MSEPGERAPGEGSWYICGAIHSVPLSGGEVKKVSGEHISPRSLITDGTTLYWVGSEPGYRNMSIRRAQL